MQEKLAREAELRAQTQTELKHLQRYAEAISLEKESVENQLVNADRTVNQLSRDKDYLEAELEQALQTDTTGANQLAQLESKLQQVQEKAEIKSEQYNVLEGKLKEAQVRVSKAEYKHRIESGINSAVKAAPIVKTAKGFPDHERKPLGKRFANIRRDAMNQASIVERAFEDAVCAAAKAENDSKVSTDLEARIMAIVSTDLEARIMAIIDEGIRHI
ncbi:MAG: hypothetical protein J4G18_07750 [Anaerolineae bacterium]|nr:hypothetical protein [Anaerolineae bacterium]